MDAEADLQIFHRKLAGENSYIHSWRTGLVLNLPIDGIGELPDYLQPSDWSDKEKGRQFIHHIMDWSLTFSTRPAVVRRGAYGESNDSNGAPLVYFASDRKVFKPDDDAAIQEESMITHQRITFSTSHRWKVFRRGWQLIPGAQKIQPNRKMTFEERAKEELESAVDHPVADSDDILNADDDWMINRYRLVSHDYQEPINISSGITYDFLQEDRRQKQIEKNREIEAAGGDQSTVVGYYDLPESWTGPWLNTNFSYMGYVLNSAMNYNLYKKSLTRVSAGLLIPQIYATSLRLDYIYEKSPEYDSVQNALSFKQNQTTSISLSSFYFPWLNPAVSYARKNIEIFANLGR